MFSSYSALNLTSNDKCFAKNISYLSDERTRFRKTLLLVDLAMYQFTLISIVTNWCMIFNNIIPTGI